MVGVIVERIIYVSMEQENEIASFVAESEQFRSTLQALFNFADVGSGDSNGTVSRKEVRNLLNDPRTHEIMSAFGINLNIPHSVLYTIMDVDRDGDTNFQEFFDACMRLCGSKQNIHSVFVQGSICECQREMTRRLTTLEKDLDKLTLHGPAGGGGGGGDPAALGSAEGVLRELLDRMDRFGQVQKNMFAEMHALKEFAKMKSESSGGSGSPGRPLEACVPRGPVVLQKAGRELGDCCSIDSLFSQRRAGLPIAPPRTLPLSPSNAEPIVHPGSARDVRERTRGALQAEFRQKRGEARPA